MQPAVALPDIVTSTACARLSWWLSSYKAWAKLHVADDMLSHSSGGAPDITGIHPQRLQVFKRCASGHISIAGQYSQELPGRLLCPVRNYWLFAAEMKCFADRKRCEPSSCS